MASNRNRLLADTIVRAWSMGETGFFIQTSGSTGEPKGMILEKEKIIWSCKKTAEFLGVLPTDSILCCLPVNRVGGWMQVARSLVWNMNLMVVEPASDPFLHYSGNHSIVSLTPMQLFTILQTPASREKLNRFRIVLIGGGEVSSTLENGVLGMRPDFYHTYGMTETYSHIALRKMNRDSAFFPLPQTEIKLNAQDCLCIKNFLTNNAWLETKDMAKLQGNGFIVLGRADNMINSGGMKILAEEMEKMLSANLQLPVGSFFYAGLPDVKFGQKPVLVVNKKLVQSLPPWESIFENHRYAKPKEIIFLDDFIYTKTGKIQRQKTLALISPQSLEKHA